MTTVRPAPGIAAEPDQNDQPERKRPAVRTLLPEGAFLQGVRGRALGVRFLASARYRQLRAIGCELPGPGEHIDLFGVCFVL